jgi:hypothetical protein
MSDAGLRKLIIEVIKDAEEWDEYGFKKEHADLERGHQACEASRI